MSENDAHAPGEGVVLPNGTDAFHRRTTRVRLSAEQRRGQILEAATKIIGDNGYRGFTVRQVAEACGLTEPSVIYHFKNKESLLVEVLVKRDRDDMTSMASNLGIEESQLWDNPTIFNLRELCAALVRGNVRQPEIVRLYTVMQAEALNTNHPAYPYFQQRERWVTNLFTRAAIHEGLDEPGRVARIFLAQMDGMQIRWLYNFDTFDFIAEWDTFSRHFQ